METTTDLRPVPSIDYDPFTPEALADPFTHDGGLREFSSLVYLERYDVYALTRQAQLRSVGRDRKTYGNRKRPFDDVSSPYKPSLMIMQDPPEHTAIKKLALELFSKAELQSLRERYEETAEEQISALTANGEIDVDAVSEISVKFISKVFPDALGLEDQNREYLAHFADAALNSTAPKNELYHRKHAQARDALAWVERNMKREVASQRGWGAQIFAMVDEGRLSEPEAEQLVKLIFAAGFDTTVGSIASMFRAFADNPDQWELLKADPSLVPNAVEEVLRYYPPVRYTGRVALRENEIDGMLVPEGAQVMMMWLSGGRDPRFWDRPDEFDITRPRLAESHMTFGVGIHQCLGQHVARMETVSVLQSLLRHVESFRLTGPVGVADNMQGFSHTSVPVRLVPTSS